MILDYTAISVPSNNGQYTVRMGLIPFTQRRTNFDLLKRGVCSKSDSGHSPKKTLSCHANTLLFYKFLYVLVK